MPHACSEASTSLTMRPWRMAALARRTAASRCKSWSVEIKIHGSCAGAGAGRREGDRLRDEVMLPEGPKGYG